MLVPIYHHFFLLLALFGYITWCWAAEEPLVFTFSGEQAEIYTAFTVEVDWGDGSTSSGYGAQTHQYSSSQSYTIAVRGDLTLFNTTTPVQQIHSFGSLPNASFHRSFPNVSVLQSVPTQLPPTMVNLSKAFAGAKLFNDPQISAWNTSQVVNMKGMFWQAESFNQPLEHWDTKKVWFMSDMFSGARSFNQALEKWDISNVRDLSYMFRDATSFNQPLQGWNINSVNEMHGMFMGATSFDQDLSQWNTPGRQEAREMFTGSIALRSQNNARIWSNYWGVEILRMGLGFVDFDNQYNQYLSRKYNIDPENIDGSYNDWGFSVGFYPFIHAGLHLGFSFNNNTVFLDNENNFDDNSLSLTTISLPFFVRLRTSGAKIWVYGDFGGALNINPGINGDFVADVFGSWMLGLGFQYKYVFLDYRINTTFTDLQSTDSWHLLSPKSMTNGRLGIGLAYYLASKPKLNKGRP